MCSMRRERFSACRGREPKSRSPRSQSPAPSGSPESARRLFAASRPIAGTIAEAYLRNRGITALHGIGALRFHPRCYYRPDADAATETWPALIAAVTDLGGTDYRRASHLARPVRRATRHPSIRRGGPWVICSGMASALGSPMMLWRPARALRPCCRFAAFCRDLPMVAALSANHFAAILLPATLRRLYVARDDDPAGDAAMAL